MKKQSKRALATKRELMEAAALLFAEKGYEGTSVQDIIQKADYSIGAFYGHFKSKPELADALYIERMSSIQQQAIAACRECADLDALLDTLVHYTLLVKDDPLLTALLGHFADRDQINRIFTSSSTQLQQVIGAVLRHTFPEVPESTLWNCVGALQAVMSYYCTPVWGKVFFINQEEENVRQLLRTLCYMCAAPEKSV